MIRRIASIFLLLAAILLIIVFAVKTFTYIFNGNYNLESRISSLVTQDNDSLYADAFAKNLCVLNTNNNNDIEISSESALLCTVGSGQAIYSKNATEHMNPASTTKIMTALVALKYGNLSDIVTVTDDAVITEAGASLCGINPGDQVSLEQLLYGLLLPSGNDAAVAIAVHIAGSVDKFADMMNNEALTIGATDSHFVNPHGLTDTNHYTSAYDLYLMLNEALKYPVFRTIAGTANYNTSYLDMSGNSISKTWRNGNKFLNGDESMPSELKVVAGKTGTTNAAGNCLVLASADKDYNEYISIILKADNKVSLYDNMTKILDKILQ